MKRESQLLKTNTRVYDMIFLDLGMPIKNGYEGCELILEHYKQLFCNPIA